MRGSVFEHRGVVSLTSLVLEFGEALLVFLLACRYYNIGYSLQACASGSSPYDFRFSVVWGEDSGAVFTLDFVAVPPRPSLDCDRRTVGAKSGL